MTAVDLPRSSLRGVARAGELNPPVVAEIGGRRWESTLAPGAPGTLRLIVPAAIGGREAFDALTVAGQRQAVRYVIGVQSPEARARRAETMTESILEAAAKRRRRNPASSNSRPAPDDSYPRSDAIPSEFR